MQKLVCEICGMIINDKNYDYNNKAFLQENDLEYIRYCPFLWSSRSLYWGRFSNHKCNK